MTAYRVRFAVILLVFLGWLGWLAAGVADKGRVPLVSRAQLTGATHVVVAEVAVGPDGLPATTATVVETVTGPPLPAGGVVEVLNLASALPPGAGQFPGAGRYLLCLTGTGPYRVAGLPRSPGYDPADPPRPMVYAWDAGTRAQLKALGLGG